VGDWGECSERVSASEPLMRCKREMSPTITDIRTRPDPSDGSKIVQAGK
jgi:hypothetical protein